uniref:receptor protein serine/threonine kinase n=1 Tax=Lates calcarifer TaxID=8187 RepID=A0A4W6EGC5_LATCA
MILQQWQLILALECIFVCISSQFLLEKRRCVFQVSPQNERYLSAGNVSGSVQVCENTSCCVGYFLVIDGQPEVDVLACDVAEKSCPDATCKTQTRFGGRVIKCVCNTDLCNDKITWTPDSEQPQLACSYSVAAVIVLVGALLVLCFTIAAARWRNLFKDKTENLQVVPHDYSVSPLCSCQQTTKTSEIDLADIEIQRILGQGSFATVWQGKYQESTVAVKVFPAGWKYKFTAEREVYELPLMKHAGILHFLGTGREPDAGSLFIVLQFAEYGSLHSFLCKHTTTWTLSLKLCQSLSQGLSYLHSDLRRYDVHKPPVAHRDLSSSNVLVRADGTCALCDFGCSTVLCSCSEAASRHSHTTNMKTHTFLGTSTALGLLLWEIWMRCSDLFEGSIAPQHLLPYESELGADVSLESLIVFVSEMDKRPSIPKHWELLPQGPALLQLLADCWDCDPEARLTAPCAVDRLVSLQSCFSP